MKTKENEGFDSLTSKMDPTVDNDNSVSLPKDTFLQAANSLKNQVVEMTSQSGSGLDPTMYTGLLGTAFICLRSYLVTGNQHDLKLSAQIIHTCASPTRVASARGGIYALGAVVSNYAGDHERCDFFLKLFLEVAQEKALPVGPEDGGFGMSYDLLYGRAGFLWAVLFINKHLGENTVPTELVMPIVDAVLAGGRAGASVHVTCPLMYQWHGTRYWGASNGLAGILHVLLHFPLSEQAAEDVKGTLRYMMSNRFPHSGNYPSSEGNPRDKLVQWSHGATNMALTLSKASQVFPNDREFREAAIEAGEVVWKNGLVKKVGLADGVSGNAYAFLSLYRLTGENLYEERAKAFASYLYHNARMLASTEGDDRAYSLFQGLAGAACLWFDLAVPENSRFPGYEI
ncbi:hypothetical protein ACFE04_021434 [Oxalis oulophora]